MTGAEESIGEHPVGMFGYCSYCYIVIIAVFLCSDLPYNPVCWSVTEQNRASESPYCMSAKKHLMGWKKATETQQHTLNTNDVHWWYKCPF